MKKYWIWFTLIMKPGYGDIKKVFEVFSTPEEVYKIDSREKYRETGLFKTADIELLMNKDLKPAEAILLYCEEKGVSVLTMDDENYPKYLLEIYNPPAVLYYKGTLPDFSKTALVGVVGTRRSTEYGEKVAKYFGREMSKIGISVVSGVAEGIDRAGMVGGLKGPTPVIGVLGCGINVTYPKMNADLYQEVLDRGGVLMTEYPPNTPPYGYNFPIRNRIIAGLSLGVLVVQAPKKSGALITAKIANDEGRSVFVVPANIDLPEWSGSNALLKAMGILTTSIEDICFELSPQLQVENVKSSRLQEKEIKLKFDDLPPDEQLVASTIAHYGKLESEQIMQYCGAQVMNLSSALVMLEVKGIIKSKGNLYKINRDL